MDAGDSEALPDNYYLINFHALASFVNDTYQDILTPAEKDWYKQISASPEAAQRLYIRLLTRKRSVFRRSRLNYPEITDLAATAHILEKRGLVSTDPPQQLELLLREFTKPELLKHLKPGNPGKLSRVALISQLLEGVDHSRQHSVLTLQRVDSWIEVMGHRHWTVFNLCFFGNLYQDSSEFVLRDLGKMHYEPYEIAPESRPFQTRAQLDSHLCYYECCALLDTLDSKDPIQLLQLVHTLPEEVEGDLHLRRRSDRFRNRVARQLERMGESDEALKLYGLSAHPPARERRVRILMGLEKNSEALDLCKKILSKPYDDAEVHVAHSLQVKLNRKLGIASKPHKRYKPVTTHLTLQPSSERVEFAAKQFYDRLGHCYYVENSLVNAVLGLLIWDVVFHPVPGAFFNPFQSAPADFHTPSFCVKRETQLKDRFNLLAEPLRFSACIMDGFTTHYGKMNPLVRWERLSSKLLSQSLQHIPAEHWQAMFNRIVKNFRDNTSGFPDLILFPDDGDYEFIEIKGPGDTLQNNQRRWMEYFAEHRIPTRVVNVRWALNSETNTQQ
ncbi:MAG: VRR-NUC domain-containing protein [Granulosicoccus sp.]